jgi:hypothetical protein
MVLVPLLALALFQFVVVLPCPMLLVPLPTELIGITEKEYSVFADRPVIVAVVPDTTAVPPPTTSYPVIALSPEISGASHDKVAVVFPVIVVTTFFAGLGRPDALVKLLPFTGDVSVEIPDFLALDTAIS